MLAVKYRLEHFERVSVLEANMAKSHVFFGGVSELLLQEILVILGFQVGLLPVKYLGMPLTSRKILVKLYQPFIDKILFRIHSWEAKLLTFAERRVLIDAVLMSLQSY